MPRDPVAVGDIQRDRAIGALLGTAAGDTLAGAGRSAAPGVWSHPTAMAIAVAEFASAGVALHQEIWQDRIVERWAWWARTADDIGPQTTAVLSALAADGRTAKAARQAAAALYGEHGGTLDGSCLTRAVPAVLGGASAEALCELTHAGPDAGEVCTLWAEAIRHAVGTGGLDVRIGLRQITSERRALWESRIAEAEQSRPGDFADAGDAAVGTFQAAWSAIATTAEPWDDPGSGVFAVDRLALALEAAVAAGGDTHSIAAAAGGLLGAAYGATAIPARWRMALQGWPGLNTHLLVRLAEKIINNGEPTSVEGLGTAAESPAPQRLPQDNAVWIGPAARLSRLPYGVEAVVSLCPLADSHIPALVAHLEVPLIDTAGANANLDFVLLDTVRTIEGLRAEGAGVFLHGRGTHSRAPAVAALYGARRAGIGVDQALAQVCALLPGADPSREFRAALRRLHPNTERALR